jgi:hypothetical protein
MNSILAVAESFRFGYLFITTQISLPVWLSFACISSLLYRVAKNSNFSFRCPGIVTAILYGVYVSTFVPTLRAWAGYGPGRVLNINYFFFLFFLFFTILYWFGWISRIINAGDSTDKKNLSLYKRIFIQKLKAVEPAILEVLVIGFVIACIFVTTANHNALTSVSATKSLTSGEARTYHNEQIARRELIMNSDLSSIAFSPFTYKPHVLFFDDITHDFIDWRNGGVAWFYEIESTRLISAFYRLGDTIHFGSTHDNFDYPQSYFVYGLEHWSGYYITWSVGNESLFSVRLDEPIRSDLHVEMEATAYYHLREYVEQTVQIYIGEDLIDEVFLPDGGYDTFHNFSFMIPKEAMRGKNFIELRFEFPDAFLPIDTWDDSTDDQIRAIGFKSLTITEYP